MCKRYVCVCYIYNKMNICKINNYQAHGLTCDINQSFDHFVFQSIYHKITPLTLLTVKESIHTKTTYEFGDKLILFIGPRSDRISHY